MSHENEVINTDGVDDGSVDEDDNDDDYVPFDSENEADSDSSDENADIDENELGNQNDLKEHEVTNGKNDSQKANSISEDQPKESEDERRKRLEMLFEDFIGDTLDSSTVSVSSKSNEVVANPASTSFGDSSEPCETNAVENMLKNVEYRQSTRSSDEADANQTKNKPSAVKRKEKCDAGLGAAISQLTKKRKTGVIAQTADDWKAFKSETGIEEELVSHNRGRKGYVDRMEFLNRADHRRFELERGARNASRNK